MLEHGKGFFQGKFETVHKLFVLDGVTLFFVLSGFLIGGILIRTLESQKASFPLLLNFWIRRWFRTIPNYLLILSIMIAWFLITNDAFQVSDVGLYFVFAQNLFYDHPAWFFPEAWSLSVEEWFYLLVPLLIFLTLMASRLKAKNVILIVAIIVLLSSTVYRLFIYSNMDVSQWEVWDLTFRKQVIMRLDSIMYGVIGAYLSHYMNDLFIRHKKGRFGLGITLLVLPQMLLALGTINFDSLYHCVLSFSITSVGTLLLIPYLSEIKGGKGRLYRWLTIISLTSYSMYLINLSLVRNIFINTLIPWDSLSANLFVLVPLKYVLFWILTILGSILIYKYYEIPLTSLRDKFKKTNHG